MVKDSTLYLRLAFFVAICSVVGQLWGEDSCIIIYGCGPCLPGVSDGKEP